MIFHTGFHRKADAVFGKADKWIMLAIILLTLTAFGVNALAKSTAQFIIIKTPLSETRYALNTNQTITLEHDGQSNNIVIQDHQVFMQSANCPDQRCVNQGNLGWRGSIICLPHGVIVSLSRENTRPDAISQ